MRRVLAGDSIRSVSEAQNGWRMRLVRSSGILTIALLAGSCSGISIFDGPERNHISVANRSDYNISVAPGSRTLLVSLDTKSAIGQRLVWAATFGTADGPAPSEFDTAASEWLKIEKPECTAANGRQTAFGSFEYDLTCRPSKDAKIIQPLVQGVQTAPPAGPPP